MLQIQNIYKRYVTGELVQTALNGVSLNLRDQEFVAILGPSGSGKTTLLNVIGGLDRYDSGDLIINGISTKKYKDRDWDSYRNHTIGFVFQSYNLIPHQSVLANVELALTISGISRKERRRRATKALEDVGLGNQLHKRPNQMSGGQMQRVAIARALVNNPDILLADEPTGALDSETSVQVMELLKEVARDRLVVMVTHNPELAETYANRIVRVRDGSIVDDTNPFVLDEQLPAPEYRNMGRASMSFFTALALSFNNLRTKKARTLLTAFAGSIGIIGIALIMSLSTGFQRYIDKIQTDTLSNYPLMIQSETADMTSAFAAFGSTLEAIKEAPDATVIEQQMMQQMFANIGSNDLESFNTYLQEHYDSIGSSINAIKYSYGVKPRLYRIDEESKILQVNPATIMTKIMGSSMMSSLMSSDIFQEMIDNRKLLESQYQVLEGRWPEDYREVVVVLTGPNEISDYMAYVLGLKDPKTLEEMIGKVMTGQEVSLAEEPASWTYQDLMDLRFQLVSVPDIYRYNYEYHLWEDMSGNKNHMKKLVESGETISVVGIVCPQDGVSATALTAGIAYLPDLTSHVIEAAKDCDIVKQQLADEALDVFTGKDFTDDSDSMLNFENMVQVDAEAISSAFGMNISEDAIRILLRNYLQEVAGSLNVDIGPAQEEFLEVFQKLAAEFLTGYIAERADESGVARLYLNDVEAPVDAFLATDYAQTQLEALSAAYAVPVGNFEQAFRPMLVGMVMEYVAANLETGEVLPEPEIPPTEGNETTDPTDATELPTEPEQPEVPDADHIAHPFEGNENDPVTDDQPSEPSQPTVPETDLDTGDFFAEMTAEDIPQVVSAYSQTPVAQGVSSAMAGRMMYPSIKEQISQKLAAFGPRLQSFIGNAFYVDQEKIAAAFQFNMDPEQVQRIMEAMTSGGQERSALTNLQQLGYADVGSPIAMSFYLTDFAGKEAFLAFLDGYNKQMLDEDREEQVISYTDMTGIMMSSVRTIIDAISYALIAFVAVSLVVSSIMIGIITYISVMERTKEIGVLRAIGASKRNISQVFNAETFIIGLCSGLIGIGITLLVLIPGNMLIHHLTNTPELTAQLPTTSAFVLIILSMVLTLIGGLIPAKQAARKDPVIALRSE